MRHVKCGLVTRALEWRWDRFGWVVRLVSYHAIQGMQLSFVLCLPGLQDSPPISSPLQLVCSAYLGHSTAEAWSLARSTTVTLPG